MLRSAILAAARNDRLEQVVSHAPVSRGVVRRFVGGSDTSAAVGTTARLVEQGLMVSLDHLGEDTTDHEQAVATAEEYLRLLGELNRAGLVERVGLLTARVEVSVKLSAVGQALAGDGHAFALEQARRICAAARDCGATVTLDMEDHTTTDATLETLRTLREDFPETGAVLQSYLRRTESDCRELAHAGSRVRLCKGAYDEPATVAFQSRDEVDRSYVRCLNVLLEGDGYPMLATHDPRLVSIASTRARQLGREPGSWEFQMLYGIRPEEQRRLAIAGNQVRVYVPYGAQWYGYLMRRLAERPANVGFFLRSLVSKG
jgi:proline dehydrogenase